MRPTFTFHVALVAVLGAVGVGLAEHAATPIKALVPDLDAADYAVREAAREQAAVSPEISLRDIEAVLTGEALSAEQRARLLVAAHERFVRGPRAALGVQMGGGAMPGGIRDPAPDPGVRLSTVFPNFPAAGVLMPGDRLLEVDGHDVQLMTDGTASFRPLVISRDPGDVVRVRLSRGGEERTVEVALGRYADLPAVRAGAVTGLSEAELTTAWLVRSAGYVTKWEDSAPIEAPLTAEQWGAAGAEPIRRDGRAPSLALVPGGRPRGTLDGARDYDEGRVRVGVGGFQPGRRGGQRGGWGGGPGVVVQVGPANPAQQTAIEKRLRDVATRMAQARVELRAAQQLVRNTNLPAEQRAAATARLEELQAELFTLAGEQAELTNRARGVIVPARP